MVARASRRVLPVWKAVVGERVFAHESGLHADGVLKDPHNYEGFDPAEVGLVRQIVVGKHSGASGMIERYRSLGIVLSRDDAGLLLPVVRHEALRRKRDLNDRELVNIYLNGAELLKAA